MLSYESQEILNENVDGCLNPYSTGSWVAVILIFYHKKISISLNPYSTGSWVAVGDSHKSIKCVANSLNPYSTGSWVAVRRKNLHQINLLTNVLILILLEVGLLFEDEVWENDEEFFKS